MCSLGFRVIMTLIMGIRFRKFLPAVAAEVNMTVSKYTGKKYIEANVATDT